MEKVSALGERLKIGGVEVGRKMSSMSFKVKDFFNGGPNQADKLVEDATSEALDEPDWALNLDLCDLTSLFTLIIPYPTTMIPEHYSDSSLFHSSLLTLFLIAPPTFRSLTFLQAPYGKHHRPGWGPNLPPQ